MSGVRVRARQTNVRAASTGLPRMRIRNHRPHGSVPKAHDWRARLSSRIAIRCGHAQ
ncbi:hypothetical protein K466DRAFT_580973 [Polyporus arcularius HHB13444]|uniref:Uncharacterized protein n=1 Tax=Polyporus arcularius HHB13444 TaxID=1314778 RepID=A0A5C3PUN0_9APHY|nr:hypothetical protein K466DRAFT_580973 [Polyporus arcularius HHB13444]